MARPFPNTFEKDSPMTPQSAASNISYQTNVTRQKTKKWAEAKTVNYGGDDWGDDDEYDYDPPPPPISKLTGPRQQSQAASSVASPIVDKSKKYDLPPLPGPSGHVRSHSFDADDEKRNFSSSTVRQPSPVTVGVNAPATRFSQITGVPTIRNSSGPPVLHISTQQPLQSQPVPLQEPAGPVASSPRPVVLPSSRGNTGDTGAVATPTTELVTPSTASDFHERRDFSPSAVPPPLTTRASPVPQSANEPTGVTFSARKSSLSQPTGPSLEDINRGSADQTTPKAWATGSSGPESSPGASSRSPTASTGKALPFIRPADIYKRAEEEKVRQSLESGRPSMDSIMGTRPSEVFDSPANHQLRHKTSSESLGATRRRMSNDTEDLSDPSRRLMPMLDTVRERKSEYGFEGFDVNDNPPEPVLEQYSRPQGLPANHLDVEDIRRQSTSPKLPDLNRISGFGMDMFIHSDLSLDKEPEITPTTASTVHDPSANEAELALRTQPSLGFRSVVNQAFDTSVPQTPASTSGSGVRRTDSESTGTTGISPIISRASSSAVPGSRNPEMSILEVVNEPTSPESMHEVGPATQQEPDVPVFKMGHRRDISAPSPGNSPARTPDLATSPPIVASGQYVEVAVASPEAPAPSNDQPLQAPRPVTDREASFRPSLPGGWTSYATTAGTEAPLAPATPAMESLSSSQTEDEHNITPTTAKQASPQPAFQSDVVSASGTSVDAVSRSPSAYTPVTVPIADSPRHEPAPAVEISPSANILSAAGLDPKPTSNLEEAPSETQLRPDVISRENSDTLSAAPTPPPKDTPRMESIVNNNGYFPKSTQSTSAAIESASQFQTQPKEKWESHAGLEVPSTVTGITPPSDDENEKLREEIVKSLSPGPLDADRHGKSGLSDQIDDGTYSSQGRESTYLQGRESTYLPSEYDNYWASTAEDSGQLPVVTGTLNQTPEISRNIEASVTSEPQNEAESAVIAPLSTHREQQNSLQPPRPGLQNRFSWEASLENVSAGAPSSSANVSELPAQDVEPRSELEASPEPNVLLGGAQSIPTLESDNDNRTTEVPSGYGRTAGIGAGAVALGAVAAVTYAQNQPSQHGRRLSLAEEKDPLVSSTSYPVSPTPPEDDHPARSPQPYLPLSTNSASPPAPSTVSPVDTPVQQHFPSTTNKLIAFKEIVAISSPKQRIDTFNETRRYWASIDNGLNDWIVRLQGQYPEHADVSGAWTGSRTGALAGSARAKFSNPPPLQQPYYQQYLNASSPTTPSTPTNPGSGSSPSFQPPPQQGFAPAGGSKLTSQQVQAKGKEFLHTAGIFGGKAGKAGKGLLAKGKNKLRGAGGGDKTNPTPPKPKSERRSSWGLPLSLSRSSNRHDSSSRHSKDSISTPTFQRSRAATTTSWEPSPAPGMSPYVASQSHSTMSGALPIQQQTPEPSEQLPSNLPTLRQVTGVPVHGSEQNAILDGHENIPTLPIPAPISKIQPSWDPVHSTPILEEGTKIEDPANQRQPSDSQRPRPSLSVPTDAVSKSERSNSDDAPFFDATEERSDNNDWVMVSPNQESKETLSKEEPVLVSNDEHVNGQLPVTEDEHGTKPEQVIEPQPTAELEIPKAMASPTTSIINRPRGSSYDIPLLSPSTKNSLPPRTPPATSSIADVPRHTSNDLPAPVMASVETVESSPPPGSSQLKGEKQSSTTSFLPPIRRTSTFGLGFNSRDPPQSDFPNEGVVNVVATPPVQVSNIELPAPRTPVPAVVPATEASPMQIRNETPEKALIEHQEMQTPVAQPPLVSDLSVNRALHQNQPRSTEVFNARGPVQQLNQQGPMWATRPPLPHVGSSNYSQQSMPVQREHRHSAISPPRPADILQRPEFRESQVEWRPNRPKANSGSPPKIAPMYNKEIDGPPAREMSWEPDAEREITRPVPAQIPEPEYDEKPQYTVPPPQPRLYEQPLPQQRVYEQPPSSAQRYPELFRPGQAGPDIPRGSADLPSQYYQAPISRGAAFLPRQQTNEYQLPGVGPPDLPPQGTSRRNSGFLKDIGGRLSRASSRERRSTSISRDQPLSRGNEYADSIAPSEGAQDRQRRRSSFFGALHTSTSGFGTPASRESVIAHHGASRTDLVTTPPTPASPIHQERKKSLFSGGRTNEPKQNTSKLVRASTGNNESMEPSKKNRFSGISSMFGKSNHSTRNSVQGEPQPPKEVSYHGRQSIEPPSLAGVLHNKSIIPQSPPPAIGPGHAREPSQSRSLFSKLAHSTTSHSSAGRETKPRRSSGAGLLGGLIGRKAATDRGSDESRSQSSTTVRGTQPVLLSQTYSDLQDEMINTPPPQFEIKAKPQRSSDPNLHAPTPERVDRDRDRGRRTSRDQRPYVEPQYDSVPIPGGYSLVRGQGATPVHTDYDPRGLNRLQPYNQYPVTSGQISHIAPVRGDPENQQHLADRRAQQSSSAQYNRSLQQAPALGAIETYQNYKARVSQQLSREDLLARSPPKSIEGQQRPYQISLPDGADDEDGDALSRRKNSINPSSVHPTVKKSTPDAIQRLQQPTLRHPESPAGYPLPEDTVFSPVNPGANDIPPPPPPKWPSHLDHQYEHTQGHERQQSLAQSMSTMDIDLDRSNTRRTAVSAVSGFSGHQEPTSASAPTHQNRGLNVPGKDGIAERNGISDRRGRGTSLSSLSPTTPSPMQGSPERGVSPEGGRDDIRRTEINMPTRPTSSEDLYNASPRLPNPTPISGANANGYHVNSKRSNSHLGVDTNTNGKGDQKISSGAAVSRAQEEKIPYHENGLHVPEEDTEPATMSATSYPGQEWNPYIAGGWDDGFD